MINENTIYDGYNNNSANASANANANEQTQLDPTPGSMRRQPTVIINPKKSGPRWVSVAGSAAGGVLLGAASTLLVGAKLPDKPEEPVEEQPVEDQPVEEQTQQQTFIGDVPVAHSVNDDMSFNEAFAAARHEVGPGGAFSWHGNVYGTYYADEWNNMSQAERDDYYAHVTLRPTHYDAPHQQSDDVAEVVSVDTTGTHPGNPGNPGAQHTQDNPGDTGGGHGSQTAQTGEIEVLGVAHNDDMNANIVAVTIDDTPAALIDLGSDNTIDVLVIDANGDGEIQENEIADISGQGLTVDQFGGVGNPTGDLIAQNDMPDYVNDANIDSYA